MAAKEPKVSGQIYENVGVNSINKEHNDTSSRSDQNNKERLIRIQDRQPQTTNRTFPKWPAAWHYRNKVQIRDKQRPTRPLVRYNNRYPLSNRNGHEENSFVNKPFHYAHHQHRDRPATHSQRGARDIQKETQNVKGITGTTNTLGDCSKSTKDPRLRARARARAKRNLEDPIDKSMVGRKSNTIDDSKSKPKSIVSKITGFNKILDINNKQKETRNPIKSHQINSLARKLFIDKKALKRKTELLRQKPHHDNPKPVEKGIHYANAFTLSDDSSDGEEDFDSLFAGEPASSDKDLGVSESKDDDKKNRDNDKENKEDEEPWVVPEYVKYQKPKDVPKFLTFEVSDDELEDNMELPENESGKTNKEMVENGNGYGQQDNDDKDDENVEMKKFNQTNENFGKMNENNDTKFNDDDQMHCEKLEKIEEKLFVNDDSEEEEEEKYPESVEPHNDPLLGISKKAALRFDDSLLKKPKILLPNGKTSEVIDLLPEESPLSYQAVEIISHDSSGNDQEEKIYVRKHRFSSALSDSSDSLPSLPEKKRRRLVRKKDEKPVEKPLRSVLDSDSDVELIGEVNYKMSFSKTRPPKLYYSSDDSDDHSLYEKQRKGGSTKRKASIKHKTKKTPPSKITKKTKKLVSKRS